MTSTIKRPPADEAPSGGHRNRTRVLYVVTAILAVATVVLAGLLLAGDDTSDGSSMPSEVEQVLDEFVQAEENADFDAYEALVTPQFRRPEYRGDPFGAAPYRNVFGLDYFERVLDGEPDFEIERIGDPIVRGDGPWYVSYAETWEYPAQDVQYEAIYTYVLVERDGEILIDDGYWAGHSVPMDS